MEGGAVAVFLELLPGLEDVPGDLEAVQAEGFLRSQSKVGVEGEVAAQMRPADLPPFRLEAVVSAEAIGANDAGELVASCALANMLEELAAHSYEVRVVHLDRSGAIKPPEKKLFH